MSKRPFEPLSIEQHPSWRERWHANQGNYLLAFAGLIAIGGVLAMYMGDEPTERPPTIVDGSIAAGEAIPPSFSPFQLPVATPNSDADIQSVRSGLSVVTSEVPADFVTENTANSVTDTQNQSPVAGSKDKFMVAVWGAVSDRGQIYIAIYGDESSFNKPEEAILRRAVRIEDGAGFLPVTLTDLPSRIAVAAFHDENDNGILDRNYLNIPQEAYGFTNRARGILGPPPYADAEMDRPPPGSELRMVIRK